MEINIMCRICLIDNVQQNIKNTHLEIVYEKLTAMPFQTDDMRPVFVCYMCYAQLRNANKFRLKCLRAEDLLTEILNELDTDLGVDHKAMLIKKSNVSPTLSVSPTVTVSTTDDDVESEEDVVAIKQEESYEHNVDSECGDVTVAHNAAASQGTLREREHSPAGSCQSDESRDTPAPADHDDFEEDFLDDPPHANDVEGEGDENIKEEITDKQDVEADNVNVSECGDVTVAHNMAASQETLREREHSPAGSCDSDESRDTRAPADHDDFEEDFLDDPPHEFPVAYEPELLSLNKTIEVEKCIQDTKCVNIASDNKKTSVPELFINARFLYL